MIIRRQSSGNNSHRERRRSTSSRKTQEIEHDPMVSDEIISDDNDEPIRPAIHQMASRKSLPAGIGMVS